ADVKVWYANSPAVLAALGGTVDLAVLGPVRVEDDPRAGLRAVTVRCALRDGAVVPAGARWGARAAVPGLDGLVGTAGGGRQPWADPGWLPAVQRWLSEAL